MLVDQLAERLSYTSAPLSARQQDQLVQTLATTATTTVTKPATNTGGKVVPAKPVTVAVPPVAPLNGALAGLGIASVASAPVTSTAIAQAQKYLSSQQLVALQQVQQEQRAQQSLNSAIAAGKPAATAAPKPTPTPTPVKTGGK